MHKYLNTRMVICLFFQFFGIITWVFITFEKFFGFVVKTA